jgi:hypothetical protein
MEGKIWREEDAVQVYMEVQENSRSRKNKRDGAWALGFQVEWGGETSPEDVAGAGLSSGGAPHVAKTGLRTSASSARSLKFKGHPGYKVRHHHPEHVERTVASNHHALSISKPATSLSPQGIQININPEDPRPFSIIFGINSPRVCGFSPVASAFGRVETAPPDRHGHV